MPDDLGRPCMQHDPKPCGPHYSPIFQPDTRDDVDPTPPPVPAEALEAAIEDFFLFAEPRYAPFDELVKARLTVAIKAVAPDLVAAGRTAEGNVARRDALAVAGSEHDRGYAAGVAAGRTAAAAAIRQYAKEWDAAKNTGAYSKGLHAAVRIAEASGDRPLLTPTAVRDPSLNTNSLVDEEPTDDRA